MFKIIDKHIGECKAALEDGNMDLIKNLKLRMYIFYSGKIHNLNNIVIKGENDPENGLKFMIDCLESYKGELMHDLKIAELNAQKINLDNFGNMHNSGNSNNTNTNTNTITSSVDVKAMIEDAKKIIEEDGSLGEIEIYEILQRLDEIETINEEDSSTNQKWRKLKDCMSWVGSKGAKVASTILPIIVQILESKGN